jgi:hypothetical protein
MARLLASDHACGKPHIVSAACSLMSSSLEGAPMDPLQLCGMGPGIAGRQMGEEIAEHAGVERRRGDCS